MVISEVLQIEEMQEQKIRWATVRFSEVIDLGSRLDAGNYGVEGKKARELIENFVGNKVLMKELLVRSLVPPPIRRIFTEDKKIGTPYVTPSELLSSKITPEKYVISQKMAKIHDWFVRENWLLITQSGLVGVPILATKTMEKYVISQNLIRLEFQSNVDSRFYYAFFKTNIGQALIKTNNYGSVVTHIEPEHLEQIQIPNPNQTVKLEISRQIELVVSLREEANRLIDNADELLFEFFKFQRLDKLKPTYFEANTIRNFELPLSKIGLRFDSSFHVPILAEIRKQLDTCGAHLTTVGAVSAKILLPGRFKRIYVGAEYGVPFLGGADIMEFDPNPAKFLSNTLHKKELAEILLAQNMILITRSGTIGNVVLCPEYLSKMGATEHIIRIIPSQNINIGYLFIFLAGEYGAQLIKRNSFGSVVLHLDCEQISNIPIPLPPREIQDKIGNLALQANELRNKAHDLEKELIKKVEELILNNQKGLMAK